MTPSRGTNEESTASKKQIAPSNNNTVMVERYPGMDEIKLGVTIALCMALWGIVTLAGLALLLDFAKTTYQKDKSENAKQGTDQTSR